MGEDKPTQKPTTDPKADAAWLEFERKNEFETFYTRGRALLQEEGIARNDPRLLDAYKKYVNPGDPKGFLVALHHAVAAVHRDEARKTKESIPLAAEKAREEVRASVKEQRRRDGFDDPDPKEPATPERTDWNTATDDEVKAELERRRRNLYDERLRSW